MTLNADSLSQQLSWRGVLAGLVMGLVSTLTIIALGTVITALTGLSLSGVGIAAAIWAGIAALIGAYLAGLTAVRASVPATRSNDGIATMTYGDATLTGLLTGALLVLLTMLFAFNSASQLLSHATNVVGAVTGTTAAAATSTGASAAQSSGLQNFLGNINQTDVEAFIADGSPDLNQEQVKATGSVVLGIFRRAQNDLGDVDLSNVANFAQKRVDAIKQALSAPQFATRLERQGLSRAEATEVQTSINAQVGRLEQQAQQTAQVAERAARTAASTAGWGWLLGAGLTLLASMLGARSAATHRVTLRQPQVHVR